MRQKAEFVMPTGPLKRYELKLTPGQRQRFIEVCHQRMKLYGHSHKDIARLTGYSYSCVEHFFRKNGKDIKNNRFFAAALMYLYSIEITEFTSVRM